MQKSNFFRVSHALSLKRLTKTMECMPKCVTKVSHRKMRYVSQNSA